MKQIESPFVCQVCGAKLRYDRIDDGIIVVDIDSAGEVEEVTNNSNGSTRIYCTADESHEVTDSKKDLITRLVEKAGY